MKIKILFLLLLAVLCRPGMGQWTVIDSISHGNLYAIHFVNADTGFAYHEFGTLRRTQDGGATWDSIAIPFSGYITDFSFPMPNVGYSVGGAWFPFGNYLGNSIMKTTDGGTTWDSVFATTGFGVFNTVATRGVDEFFAAGTFGIIHSDDGGITIDTVSISAFPQGAEVYSRIRFIDMNTGYALASAALFGGQFLLNLYETSNGAQSWQSIYSDTVSRNDLDFVFTANGDGMISGLKGKAIITHDGGQSWHTQSLDTSLYLFKMEEKNGEVFAVGYNTADTTSGIYRTKDWGQSWQTDFVNSSLNGFIADLSIPTANTGYFITYQRIYKKEHLFALPQYSSSDLEFYPNPTPGLLNIRLQENGPAEVKIFNPDGREIYHHTFLQATFQLQLDELPMGVYLMEVRQNGSSTFQKFVKG